MKALLEKINIRALPYLRLFVIVFLLINLIGIINFPFYKEKMENGILYLLVFLGLIGFISGTILIRILKIKFSPSKGTFKPHILKFIFWGSNIFSFVLILATHAMNGGIIILMGAARFKTISYTNIFIYLGIVTTLLFFSSVLLANKKVKWWHIIFIAIQSVSVLSLGYRSPLIILAGGCALIFVIVRNDFQNKYKNVFTFRNFLVVLGVLVLMSSISSYRVSRQYDVRKFFKNVDLDYMDDHRYLMPFMPTLAVFRYDQEVVKTLVKKTEGNHYYGYLAIANFLTVLPGEQLGVRNIIGEIVEARKLPDGKPWSITPTLQGALFVDGGYFGVFFGFFVLGVFIEYLKKLMKAKKDPFSIALYVLVTINVLMLIHTGYFDVVFFILMFVILMLKIVITRVRYTVSK
ncbi:oligosaccharide repeat unit polymerase [Aequorivita sinensis]|uniref:oligosaccharide repeat unit polymerase n=1 Tax=Aequorivita sinensis TaxID=1382458 RepID=UPI002300FD4C|nr:oligosaccharide repeat unit polymerase [Aequorivita sinensis]